MGPSTSELETVILILEKIKSKWDCVKRLFLKIQLFIKPAGLQRSVFLQSSALGRLLAAGRHAVINSPVETVLCRHFGIAKQVDWPVAPFSLLGEGMQPASAYWLHADPVHLDLQRDYFTLGSPVPLHLHAEESKSLLDALNQHFNEDGLQFFSSPSGRCYLRLERSPEVATHFPDEAMGRDVRAYMPQGSGAVQWDRLLNEIQMLLFDHPVNRTREEDNLPVINSIWFSGGGVLPNELQAVFQGAVYGDSLARGIARFAGLSAADLPDYAEVLRIEPGEDILLVLENNEDAEKRWIAPLLGMLGKRKIKGLELNMGMRNRTLNVQVNPLGLWKFWRKPKPIEAYLSGKRF